MQQNFKKFSIIVIVFMMCVFLFSSYSMGHYMMHQTDGHVPSDCCVCQVVEMVCHDIVVFSAVITVLYFSIFFLSVKCLFSQTHVFSNLVSLKVQLND